MVGRVGACTAAVHTYAAGGVSLSSELPFGITKGSLIMLHRRIVLALSMSASIGMSVAAAQACAPDVADAKAGPPWAPALALHREGGPEGAGQRIVASDQYRGDLDARAFSWLGGTGYRMHAWEGPGDRSLLHGFAAIVDGGVLPRAQAVSDTLRPWGHELRYASDAREGLQLQAGYPVVSLCASSDKGRPLALLLMLGPDTEGMVWRSSVPVDAHPVDASIRQAVGASDDIRLLRLEPRSPVDRLTVHVAFARSEAESTAALDAMQHEADAQGAGDIWAAGIERRRGGLSALQLRTGDTRFDEAFRWAVASNATFRSDEFGPGLWAGLPWFRDHWGRDTFIALPGTHLVTGEFDRAQSVIAAFADRQKSDDGPERGRVPNRVAAATDTLYNTVDGTPWLIRAAWEAAQASGDARPLPALRTLIRNYVAGAEAQLDADGLLRHAEADTWMDARIRGGRGWSPRGDRAIEIQALWHAVLAIGADLAARAGDENESARYAAMAERTRAAVLAHYWNDGRLADRLLSDGRVDTSVRPNAWLAVSVPPLPQRFPLLPIEVEARVARDTTKALLLPRGPLSLSAQDPRFHPRHVDDAHHNKDAAYHNGTVWAWTAGPAITALARFGQQDTAYVVSRELARQILEDDAPGHLAELTEATLDADARVRPSGTYAQSWSSAEFVRNAVQDYLGVHPRLLDGVVEIRPALPRAWRHIEAVLPLGQGEPLRLRVTRDEGIERWHFAPRPTPLTIVMPEPFVLHETAVIVERIGVDAAVPWPLADEPTPPPGGWAVQQGRDVLERFIEVGGLDRHPQPTPTQLLAPEAADVGRR